jgi:hypothetical protein
VEKNRFAKKDGYKQHGLSCSPEPRANIKTTVITYKLLIISPVLLIALNVGGQPKTKTINGLMDINYNDNKLVIKSFYTNLGLADEFEKDNVYLENAFNEIKDIWFKNFNKIDKINFLLIAESPLWGSKKKYIYNPDTKNSQFFYRSDLEQIFHFRIKDKRDFIKICNEIGLLVVDISPFPLNTKDTRINYARNENGSTKISKNNYKELVKLTLPSFFDKKIKLVGQKKHPEIKVFFRYTRVQNAFQDLISDSLIEKGLIKDQKDILEIAQRGGGIDRIKLGEIVNAKRSPNR